MSNNAELIKAIKDADNAIAKAMNLLRKIAAEHEGNPHPYISIPGNPRKEMEANMLCCSCDYCEGKRFGRRYGQNNGHGQ